MRQNFTPFLKGICNENENRNLVLQYNDDFYM